MQPFKPNNLPLKALNWDKFLQHIGGANRAVAKFDGYLQSIPNSRVLLSPLLTKEAVVLSKSEKAKVTLERTIDLKNNYKDPRFALAILLVEEKNYDEAKYQLEYIQKNIDPFDEKVNKKLQEISSLSF